MVFRACSGFFLWSGFLLVWAFYGVSFYNLYIGLVVVCVGFIYTHFCFTLFYLLWSFFCLYTAYLRIYGPMNMTLVSYFPPSAFLYFFPLLGRFRVLWSVFTSGIPSPFFLTKASLTFLADSFAVASPYALHTWCFSHPHRGQGLANVTHILRP